MLKDKYWVSAAAAHQEGTETVEAEKVEDSEVGPTGELLSRLVVRLGVTLLPIHGSHHDLLPSLSSCTSGSINYDLGSVSSIRDLLTNDRCSESHRNNIRTAWGNVWKLLLRLIWVPSTNATFPKIWRVVTITVNIREPEANPKTCLSGIYLETLEKIQWGFGLKCCHPDNKYLELYLHPDDGVDKEEHHDEQSNVRKSLLTQTKKYNQLTESVLKSDD